MTTTLHIDARFCGPPGAGNGGYSAGRLATHLTCGRGEAVEVTLRVPVPLGRQLSMLSSDRVTTLHDGETLVATARVVPFQLDAPERVPFDLAVRIARESPVRGFVDEHPCPGCFVCGPDREPSDGLRLFAARVPGMSLFAVPWEVADVGAEFVWAALDCPSGFPKYLDEDPFPDPCVLGQITARVERIPAAGERTVVVAWREGVDGRKLHTASVLYDEAGRLGAAARATWIRVAEGFSL